MSLVVAVIPSYLPDATQLSALVERLLDQCPVVLVSDDASPDGRAVDAVEVLGAEVLRHEVNAGIARGLNDGLRRAIDQGATWLLTCDQDSMISADYVHQLVAAATDAVAVLGPHAVGAVGAGSIDESSGSVDYPVRYVSGLPCTEELIQTGTLWSVAGLQAIGGFDEILAIDAVDAAACVRLRASGRRLVLAPGVTIEHRLGNARRMRLLGREVLVTEHSAERRTTMVRNRLRLAPEEFAQSPKHAFRTLRRLAVSTLLAVTVEDDRWAKAKASARGLFRSKAVHR